MTEEDSTVMRLMSALITKMEHMDSEIGEMRQQMRNPDAILKRAGLIRTQSPSVSDVWGDPLRGDRIGVIEKAGDGTEVDVVNMPSNNEEWHEMEWADIHALAQDAGAPADRGGDFSTNRRDFEAGE